jgi:phosphatidylserine/phosphatidylglycerophosphate/cardiolipin synthase-like enzyme
MGAGSRRRVPAQSHSPLNLHNKVMVIDGQTVVTGSFNFTKAAENSNAENVLIIHDGSLASKYEKNWQDYEAQSEAYEDRRK